MIRNHIWKTSDDKTIDYISLTSEYLNDALKVLRTGYYPDELLCSTLKLTEDMEAMVEMDNFVKNVCKEGVSIIAVERKTNTVCGVAFNKLQAIPTPGETSDFNNYARSCKRQTSRDLIEFMDVADGMHNLFDICKVDCILEVNFLTTLPEFRARGIAVSLCEVSECLAKSLKLGKENVKQPIDGTALPLKPAPQALSALFTSPYSRKVGRKLNWTIIEKMSFDKVYVQGKPFSGVSGYFTIECKNI